MPRDPLPTAEQPRPRKYEQKAVGGYIHHLPYTCWCFQYHAPLSVPQPVKDHRSSGMPPDTVVAFAMEGADRG